MRKCFLVVSLCIVLALVLGCSSTPTATPAPAPTARPAAASPTSAPAAAPTATAKPAAPTAAPAAAPAAAKPIEMKMSVNVAPAHVGNKILYTPLKEMLEQRSNGRIKVTIYYSEALAKSKDQLDAVIKGIADIGVEIPSFHPGRFPISSVVELPFAVPSGLIGSHAIWNLYKKGLLKEWDEVKVIELGTSEPWNLMMSKKKPMSMADLKGTKIRTPGGEMTKLLESAGIAPISMPAADTYVALDRGTADGTLMGYASAPGYKIQEVAKVVAEVAAGSNMTSMIMNKEVWNKLPDDLKKVVDSVSDELVERHGKGFDAEAITGKGLFEKAGASIYTFPEAERTKWVQMAKPLWQGWAADMDKKGLPGTAAYNEFLSFLKSQGVSMPF